VFLCLTALQVDFSRHALENVRIVNNLQDGLGVLYSDLYSSGVANTVKNSEFSSNRGNGISFKQLGLKISGKISAYSCWCLIPNFIGIIYSLIFKIQHVDQ
jgi:hypothetical protein